MVTHLLKARQVKGGVAVHFTLDLTGLKQIPSEQPVKENPFLSRKSRGWNDNEREK